MNFRQVEKILKENGWIEKNSKGSHFHYIHPMKKGKITIPKHTKKGIDIKTLKSIFKYAGIEVRLK